jgi:hypothetical protein
MDKEQLIKAIIHNAQATLSFAKDSNDPQLECIAHATLLAVTATQQGHDDELLSLLAAFVAFQLSKEEVQEREVQEELSDILKNAGIHTLN